LVATVAIVGGTIATSAVLEARAARLENPPSDPSLPVDIGRDPSLATSADTDGDTLLDWEESLRGTNPREADTDGDGTSDGAEVAAGRDPKVAGPNDSVTEVASSTDAAASSEYQANRKRGTLTDQFAESFAQQYVSLKAENGFTEDDERSLLANLTGSIVNGKGTVSTTYRADLVPRLESESEASLKTYADAFADAHLRTFAKIGSQTSLPDDEYNALFGDSFRKLGAQLCGLQTPTAIAAAAAAACNANETIGAGILAMSSADDPLAGLLSIPSLQKAEQQRVASYQEISQYLAGRGVALQAGSYAGFWNQMALSQ
jgi:hypothetical protein